MVWRRGRAVTALSRRRLRRIRSRRLRRRAVWGNPVLRQQSIQRPGLPLPGRLWRRVSGGYPYAAGQFGYGERVPCDYREPEHRWEGQHRPQHRSEVERGWERGEDRGWYGGWDPAWHDPRRRAWAECERERGEQHWGRGESGHGESWTQSIKNFFGVGPKGYRRSDQRICDEVCDRLTDDPRINASDISVRVEEGEVHLEGSVESRWMKHLAEDVAETVSGVRDVDNRLRVRREADRFGPEERREMPSGKTHPGEGSHLISRGSEPADAQKHAKATGEAPQSGATGQPGIR